MDKQYFFSTTPNNSTYKKELVRKTDSLVDNQNYYLFTEGFVSFSREWSTVYDVEEIVLDVSTSHPFSIILALQYASFMDPVDDLNVAKIYLGIKDPQKEYKKCIEMGLYMGRLFIKDIFDFESISKEKLVEGIQIILNVIPGSNGKSSATLKAVDLSGSVISMIKTGKILNSDWNGEISTGAHFKSIRIEGIQSE